MQLKDPINNRVAKNASLPFQGSLQPTQLFGGDSVDFRLLLKFYQRQGKLSKQLYMQLIKRAKLLFQKQHNLIRVEDPVTIVGDIHGQLYDLANIFSEDVGGAPQNTKYVFLGDYVDRGSFSVEVIGLLLAIKVNFKDNVFMLRGNHECRKMTTSFNFRAQCLQKYDQEIYQAIMDLFDCLPLAVIVNNKFLCIHGGISTALTDIERVRRFKEIPRSGALCDLVWADPIDNENGKLNELIKFNEQRGCSYYFGYNLAKSFLASTGLSTIIRAHQVQNQGFKPYYWGGSNQLPTVITLFSAPNYCDFYNNKGAILKLKNNNLQLQQFAQVQHPYLLPNFMNLFEWSIPFVSQKISEMLYHLLKPDQIHEQKDMLPLFMIQQKEFLEKSLDCLHHITKEHAQSLNLGGRILDNKLLQTVGAKQEITEKKGTTSFARKRTLDLQNQKRPVDTQTSQEEKEPQVNISQEKMIQI